MKRFTKLFAGAALFFGVAAAANTQAAASTPDFPVFNDAHDIVESITAGWNLGNTLDAHPHGAGAWAANPSAWTPSQQETLWGNPITTQENIQTIHEAGFNAIRIPITFYTMIDDEFNIREDWMERIVEIVDYAYDDGMIVIINTHHDERWIGLGLTDADGNLVPQYAGTNRETLVTFDESVDFLTSIWTQLSDQFADYSHRLIFEGLNEPRTIGSFAEWGGGTAVERENLNLLNQVFVDTVRDHGEGYNADRFLMVPTYAAAVGNNAFDGWRMPADAAGADRIIVSLHAYAPWEFAGEVWGTPWDEFTPQVRGAVNWALNLSRETFPNYPIIIGEMGNLNRDNLADRVAWTAYYTNLANELGIRVFWWDNGQFGIQQIPGGPDQFAIFDRRTNSFPFPEINEALLNPLTSLNAEASVTRLQGNQNDLQLTLTKELTGGYTFETTETFRINNNASGTFRIGNRDVFVNTQGNTQIRELRIVE